MIDINLNNYEEYFIDYLDGNLNPSEVNQLMSFLDLYPELKEELNSFDNEIFAAPEEVFKAKEILKRNSIIVNTNSDNFDELCIAKLEGDLSDFEVQLFDKFIKSDSARARELELYKKVKLSPDNAIVYPEKFKLKRKVAKTRKLTFSIISAAASVIVVVGLYFLVPKQKTENIQAETEKTKVVIEEAVELIANSNIQEEGSQSKIEESIISKSKTGYNNTSIKEEVNIKSKGIVVTKEQYNEDFEEKEQVQLAYLNPIKIDISNNYITTKPSIREVTYFIPKIPQKQNGQISFKSFIAQSINNKLFDKKKDKIELFDIAQAGVESINKLAGTNMSLERVYDEKGNVNKTAFNSKLLAFSTPVKK